MREDPRCSLANTLFAEVEQPGVGPLMVSTQPLSFGLAGRVNPARAPRLGEHTESVLAELLGTSATEYARLHDAGVVAGPERA